MEIEGKELEKVNADLNKALASGLNYMVVKRTDDYLSIDRDRLFASKQKAELHTALQKDMYKEVPNVLPVKLLAQYVARAIDMDQQRDLNIEGTRHIYVDLDYLLHQEIIREERYLTELQDQLIKSGFSGDTIELLYPGIVADLPDFEFNAKRLVMGHEELYTVRIEQNADRVFEITAILPELGARISQIDWRHVYYDPLEQNAEWGRPEERMIMHALWKIVDDVQCLAESGPNGLKQANVLQDKYWKDTPMEGSVKETISEHLKKK